MSVTAAGAQLPVSTAATSERAAAKPQPVEAAKPAAAPRLSIDMVKAVAQQLESYLRSVSRSLEFRVDSSSGRTVVTVLDSETGDVIRQIPNEEVLHLAQMAEDQTVVLVNETV